MADYQTKWQKSFKISSYHVDLNRQLTIPSLCHYFQEIAYEHAEHLNFGYNYLKSVKKFWILSRLQFEIYQLPVWGDEIVVTTWPRGMDGMFALREFVATQLDGTKLAGATSSWLILDEERHFPQRINPEDFVEFSKTTESALNLIADKLPKVENITKSETFSVKFSDVDVNKHVNNSMYIQWAINSLPIELLISGKISSLLVNFLGEASFGDNISLWKSGDLGGQFFVSIQNESKGKELCKVQIKV